MYDMDGELMCKPPSRVATHAVVDDSAACPSAEKPQKLKWFVYTVELNYQLVKCVREKDAHTETHGKKGELFSADRDMLLFIVPPSVFSTHNRPSQKYMQDRLKRLKERCRQNVKETEVQSGIAESLLLVEKLLDHLILEKEEAEEQHCAKRDEQKECEERLLRHRKDIRDMVIRRSGGITEEIEKVITPEVNVAQDINEERPTTTSRAGSEGKGRKLRSKGGRISATPNRAHRMLKNVSEVMMDSVQQKKSLR